MGRLDSGHPGASRAAGDWTVGAPAIIVTGDTLEVIGSWKVAIHDNSRTYQPWEKPYYVLSAGDSYNMKTRRIIKLNDGMSGRRQSGTAEPLPLLSLL